VEIGGVGGRRTDLIVTMHALGTAIAAGVSPGAAAAPRIALDLQLSSSKDHLLGGAR
jgi:hypothetical protein